MKNKYFMKIVSCILSLMLCMSSNSVITINAADNNKRASKTLTVYEDVDGTELSWVNTLIVPANGRIEITDFDYTLTFLSLDSHIEYRFDESKSLGDGYEYFVRVPKGRYSLSREKYISKLRFIPELPSEYEQEDNNSYDTATPINCNTEYKGSVSERADEHDYYKVTVPEKGSIYFQISAGGDEEYVSLGYSLYKEKIDGNLEPIALDKGADGGSLTITDKIRASKNEVYYVVISAASSLSNYTNYTIKAAYKEDLNDGYETENNNTEDTANSIDVNKEYIGNLENSNDEDCFKFTIDKPGKLQLRLKTPRQKANGIFAAQLLDELDDEGEEIDRIVSGNNNYTYGKTKILMPGIYYVRIRNARRSNDYFDEFDDEVDDNKILPISHIDYSMQCVYDEQIMPEKVTINKKKSLYKVGDKIRMTVKLFPENTSDKNIRWKSLNTKIATISKKGILRCKKPGVVIIRASSELNYKIYDEVKVTIKKK